MDKTDLDTFSQGMMRFWGYPTLDEFSSDTLLLADWAEVVRQTVAVYRIGEDPVSSIVVTLDGDGEYCVWESASLEEAWGTDAWFANADKATAHAVSLIEIRRDTL